VLVAPTLSRQLHIGATVGIDLLFFDEQPAYQLFATARGRLWLGEWVTLEGAIGPAVTFDDSFEEARRVGGIFELAFTIHGHIGLFVQGEALYGDPDMEYRVSAGIRGSLLGWILMLAAASS